MCDKHLPGQRINFSFREKNAHKFVCSFIQRRCHYLRLYRVLLLNYYYKINRKGFGRK
jgi:hypothetical protein